jgi:hypothetical protein
MDAVGTRNAEARKMKKRKPAPTVPAQEPGTIPTGQPTGQGDGEMVWLERRAARAPTTGPPTLRLATAAGKSGRPARNRPERAKPARLSRAVLAALGKGLEDCFDEVRKQEVPERFKLLLQQF